MVDALVLAQGLGTGGLQTWIRGNVVPLLLLLVAILVLWLGGSKGDNAGVMRRVFGTVIALALFGLAVGGGAENIGVWLSGLFTTG